MEDLEKVRILELLEASQKKLEEAWGRLGYTDGTIKEAYTEIEKAKLEVKNA